MTRSYSSSVMLGERRVRADAGDVEHRVDPAEGSSAAANIASTVASSATSTRNGTTASPSRRRGLLLAAADVGGEHLGAFPDEHLGRRAPIPEPAPVMTATFPSSLPSRRCSLFRTPFNFLARRPNE